MHNRAISPRIALVAALLVGTAAAIAGCGSGAAATPGDSTLCLSWCGTGSATVSNNGATTTIKPGGCIDQGPAGIDARFGDLREDNATGDYVAIRAFRADGPTAVPVPTLAPLATPGDSVYPSYSVVGFVAGQPFILGTDAVIVMKDARGGTFSGTDVNGYGSFTGTFSCS